VRGGWREGQDEPPPRAPRGHPQHYGDRYEEMRDDRHLPNLRAGAVRDLRPLGQVWWNHPPTRGSVPELADHFAVGDGGADLGGQAGDGAGLAGLEGCSIIMASMTRMTSPSATVWPSSTATLTMVPCIGEATESPEAAAPAFLPPPRGRGAESPPRPTAAPSEQSRTPYGWCFPLRRRRRPARQRYKPTSSVPALRESELVSGARYQRLFRRYIGQWGDKSEASELRSELMAAAVVAAHNRVLRRWLRAECVDPQGGYRRGAVHCARPRCAGRRAAGRRRGPNRERPVGGGGRAQAAVSIGGLIRYADT